MAVIADTSALIDYLDGHGTQAMDAAVFAETLVLPPIVIAELLSGSDAPAARLSIREFLPDFPMHEVDLSHWIAVGNLRRNLKQHGLTVTIPDAHVAQCAIDLDATLIARDKIFRLIAEHIPLRLA